jgi:hypothetical protein|tara:strand:+ start:251 stop:451 length:201 start_codon:yes stop_codon:yes gene_type:complete
MKTLKELRAGLKSTSKKINGYPVVFTSSKQGMIDVSIDGDKFDTFPNQKTAEKMAKEFIKQLKTGK